MTAANVINFFFIFIVVNVEMCNYCALNSPLLMKEAFYLFLN